MGSPSGLPPEAPPRRQRPMAEIEREAIIDALAKTRHNISEACRLLGIPRTTMYRRLRRHRIPAARE